MAPKEQLRSLCFLGDMLRLLLGLQLPQVVLHLAGKLVGDRWVGVELSGGPV